MTATTASLGDTVDEHEQQAVGWVAGLFGLLLALVAWGREVFKRRQDITQDFGNKMLARIEALEKREAEHAKQAQEREDTLRVRIDAVEKEADECQRQHAVLTEKHGILLREVEDTREENDTLRAKLDSAEKELGTLRRQNHALHEELESLYKQLGWRRTTPGEMPKPPTKKG